MSTSVIPTVLCLVKYCSCIPILSCKDSILFPLWTLTHLSGSPLHSLYAPSQYPLYSTVISYLQAYLSPQARCLQHSGIMFIKPNKCLLKEWILALPFIIEGQVILFFSVNCLWGILPTSGPEEQLCTGEYIGCLEPTNTGARHWGLKLEQLPKLKIR